MKHSPHGDSLGISTNELICILMSRADASSSMFSLLGLMIEMSDEMSIQKQYLTAECLKDAAHLIEDRPAVQDFKLALALAEGVTSC
jgi:hypothetical protein